MTTADNYAHKSIEYYQSTQEQLVDLIDGEGHHILELGCGDAHTGALLKALGKADRVDGIEIVPEAAQRARQQIDTVTIGNVETMEFPFEHESFAYILATEVLEHLIDPYKLLLRLKPFLQPNGSIIASVPNMRHLRILWQLAVQGDWRYEDSGPLDRTHLRFFTKRSLTRLFTDAGYEIETLRPVLLRKAAIVTRATVGMFEDFLAFRYYCRARLPKG